MKGWKMERARTCARRSMVMWACQGFSAMAPRVEAGAERGVGGDIVVGDRCGDYIHAVTSIMAWK